MARLALKLAGLLAPLAAVLMAGSQPAAAQTKPCVAPLGWWESKGLEPFFTSPAATRRRPIATSSSGPGARWCTGCSPIRKPACRFS